MLEWREGFRLSIVRWAAPSWSGFLHFLPQNIYRSVVLQVGCSRALHGLNNVRGWANIWYLGFKERKRRRNKELSSEAPASNASHPRWRHCPLNVIISYSSSQRGRSAFHVSSFVLTEYRIYTYMNTYLGTIADQEEYPKLHTAVNMRVFLYCLMYNWVILSSGYLNHPSAPPWSHNYIFFRSSLHFCFFLFGLEFIKNTNSFNWMRRGYLCWDIMGLKRGDVLLSGRISMITDVWSNED